MMLVEEVDREVRKVADQVIKEVNELDEGLELAVGC